MAFRRNVQYTRLATDEYHDDDGSGDTWEDSSPKHMACSDLGFYPSSQDSMKHELRITPGGVPKGIVLHLSPLTDLRCHCLCISRKRRIRCTASSTYLGCLYNI